jgi:hypothetical protein
MNKRLFQLMQTLDITEQEALELIEDDEKIDKGEKLFELTDEQKANSKKARQTGTRTQTTPTKRERKADTDKREIIQNLDEVLTDFCDDVTVTNPERQIDFEFNGRKFRVVLSAPRS